MEVADKTLAFDRGLWVQYGGVDVAEDGARIVVTGRDEDSYLKVFNHFGRVLKLYTFEDGRWVDSDTGATPGGFDDHLAGYVSEAPPLPGAPAAAPAAKSARKRAGAKSTAKAAAKSTKAAGTKRTKTSAAKAGGKATSKRTTGKVASKSGGKRAGSAGASGGRGRGTGRTGSRPAAK